MPSISMLLTLLVVSLASVRIASSDDDAFPRIIRIAGQGKSSVAPDMATIQTGVVTQAKTAVEAMAQNSDAIQKIMEDLKTREIDGRDIQTSQFGVQPVYDRGERGERKPEIVGYQVSNQLRIRVRKLPELGDLLDTLIRSGSNQVSGITFGVTNENGAINDARAKAILDARKKATLYAKTAGVAVGKVIAIDEQPANAPRPEFYGRAMEMSASSVPIAAGELDFMATITMTLELVDQ